MSEYLTTFEEWFSAISTDEAGVERSVEVNANEVNAKLVALPQTLITTYLRRLLLEAGSLCKCIR